MHCSVLDATGGDVIVSQPWSPELAWWPLICRLLANRVQMGTHMPLLNDDILGQTQPPPQPPPHILSPKPYSNLSLSSSETGHGGDCESSLLRLCEREVRLGFHNFKWKSTGWSYASCVVRPLVPARERESGPLGKGIWVSGRNQKRVLLSGSPLLLPLLSAQPSRNTELIL